MEVTVDVWRMSTDLITIIPNFSGFHEEEFTLSPKSSLHSLSYPSLGKEVTLLLGSFGRRS